MGASDRPYYACVQRHWHEIELVVISQIFTRSIVFCSILVILKVPDAFNSKYFSGSLNRHWTIERFTDSKVHGANMGPTWVLSAPEGRHVGPINLAIRVDHYDLTTT